MTTRAQLTQKLLEVTKRAVIYEGTCFISARVPVWKINKAKLVMAKNIHFAIGCIVRPFKWYEYLTVWSIKFKEMWK